MAFVDFISSEVNEFSLRDGRYLRSVGRKGRGPGEYRGARSMSVDADGVIYVHDAIGGQVMRYNPHAEYIDKIKWIGGRRIACDRDGALFLLGVNATDVLQLQKTIPGESWSVQFTIPLSTKDQGFLATRMGPYSQLRYNRKSHRIYYLGPNDSMVKEIDAARGEIVRQFGLFVPEPVVEGYKLDGETRSLDVIYSDAARTPDYVPMAKNSYGMGSSSGNAARNVQFSRVTAMTMISDRYIIAFYTHPSMRASRIIYDLEGDGAIRAYSFNREASKVFTYLSEYSDEDNWASAVMSGTQVAALRDEVYIYQPPLPRDADESNGLIKIYTLSFPE